MNDVLVGIIFALAIHLFLGTFLGLEIDDLSTVMTRLSLKKSKLNYIADYLSYGIHASVDTSNIQKIFSHNGLTIYANKHNVYFFEKNGQYHFICTEKDKEADDEYAQLIYCIYEYVQANSKIWQIIYHALHNNTDIFTTNEIQVLSLSKTQKAVLKDMLLFLSDVEYKQCLQFVSQYHQRLTQEDALIFLGILCLPKNMSSAMNNWMAQKEIEFSQKKISTQSNVYQKDIVSDQLQANDSYEIKYLKEIQYGSQLNSKMNKIMVE